MTNRIATAAVAIAIVAPSGLLSAQPTVRIIDLPAATAKTAETFGAILSVREVASGKVFVNDGGRRQISLYEASLAMRTIARDSADGSETSYGPVGFALSKWAGDSLLFGDIRSRTLLILDGSGRTVRAFAMPVPLQIAAIGVGGYGGLDGKGRMIYRGPISPAVPGTPNSQRVPDSNAVVRMDLDARRMDTLGMVKVRDGGGVTQTTDPDGRTVLHVRVNPSPAPDEWAYLADGSIALVRGRDYHIDWIHADGTKHSTAKLPFDWKRMTDDEKQKKIDSAKAVFAERERQRAANQNNPAAGGGGGGAVVAARGGGGGGGGAPSGPPPKFVEDYPALNEIFDFHPAIRAGAAMADLEGNVWILPTTSAQSKAGELVYDVTNVKGDFVRVRMPVGRSVAGFGKGGVVFLQNGDREHGFVLERTKLPGGSPWK